MNLLSIFNKKPASVEPVEEKSYTNAPVVPNALSRLLGKETGLSYSDCFSFYERSEPVASVIDLIAENFAHLPIYLEVNGQIIKDHPVLDLLKQPDDDYSGQLFLTIIATYYLICGEVYVLGVGNVNFPIHTLVPINPLNVTVTQGSNGLAETFEITGQSYRGTYVRKTMNAASKRRVFVNGGVGQLKQIRRFSSKDNSQFRGESKMTAIAANIRLSLAGIRHNQKVLNKGGFLSLLFSIKDDMSFLKFQEVKQQIHDQYSGTESESVAVVNANQIDVSELGLNPKDMDFAAMETMVQKSIAKRYNVPLQMVNDQTSSYNNLSTAYQQLYDACVLPLASDILGGLGAMLLPRFDIDASKAKLCVDTEKVPSLAFRRAELAEKKRASYAVTDNEIRRCLHLPDVERGDQIYRPAGWVSDEQMDEVTEPSVARDNDTSQSRY